MNQRFWIFTILIFCFFSCTSSKNKRPGIKEFMSEVNPIVLKKFPINRNIDIEKCKQFTLEFPDAYEITGYCGISIFTNISDEDLKLLVADFEKAKIQSYNSSDEDLLLISDESDTLQTNSKKISYPLYNSYESNREDDSDILSSENLDYYVFECKEGKYLSDKYFQNGNRLRENFYKKTYLHGFCNGATVDKKLNKIVYWLVIW